MPAETPTTDTARVDHKRAAYAHMGDVGVDITVELGRKRMSLSQARRLRAQDVIILDKAAGEALEVRANGHLFAAGEIIVVYDQVTSSISQMACRITQFIQQARR